MIELPDGADGVDELKRILPNYHLNLVCAEEIEHPELFRTSLQHIFVMIKYNSDKRKLYEYVKEHRKELHDMDEDSYLALFALLGEQKRLMKLMEKKKEFEEEFIMCKAIDDLIEDGRIAGIEQGREQGIEALVLDNLEEHKTEEQIQIKLVKRFSLSHEEARAYVKKYMKAHNSSDRSAHLLR